MNGRIAAVLVLLATLLAGAAASGHPVSHGLAMAGHDDAADPAALAAKPSPPAGHAGHQEGGGHDCMQQHSAACGTAGFGLAVGVVEAPDCGAFACGRPPSLAAAAGRSEDPPDAPPKS